MIVKVCGMRNPQNIEQVASLGVNWIGFIFYPQSPRCVSPETFNLSLTTHNSCRVGVFVDAPIEQMVEAAHHYQLDYLQLHGNESPDCCLALQKRGLSVIKAFAVSSPQDIEKAEAYNGFANYFLFDTKCEGRGGSGLQFDWSILSYYKGETPFLLSGGIHPASVEAILNLRHPQLAGIDLNSGFEIAPGLKDIKQLATFLAKLRACLNFPQKIYYWILLLFLQASFWLFLPF